MGTISKIGKIEGINSLKNTITNTLSSFRDNVPNQLNNQSSSTNEIKTEYLDLDNLPTNDYTQTLTQNSASNTNWDKYMEDVNKQAEENDKCIELYTNLKEEINNTIESSQAGYEYETVSQMMNQPGMIDSDTKNKDEMLEWYYNFTGLSKYGIHNREELDNYMKQLDQNINSMQYNKKSVENLKKMIPYLKIMSGEDYQNFDNKNIDISDLSTTIVNSQSSDWRSRNRTISISYNSYIETTGKSISPADFLNKVNELPQNIRQIIIIDVEEKDKLELLLEASEINPDLLKCYNYIFYKHGKEEATKFLNDAEEEINKTVGMKRAGEFLSKLPKDKNIKDMTKEEIESYINDLYSNGIYEVQNEDYGGIRDILVALKGGKDGIRQYFEGLKGWFTESTSRSALDFEKMYILYALMPESYKKEIGLINNEGQSIIDPKILDFSQTYNDKLGITDNIYEIATSIGNMAPSMIVGSILPGLGSIGAGTVSVFLSSGGNARREGLIKGMDATKATLYGIANGMTEAALVELLSTLPGLRGKEQQIKTLKQLALAMTKEGQEEGLEEIASILIDYMFTGEMVTLEEATQRVEKSVLYGAITSGIMNTPGVAINTANQVMIDMNDAAFKAKAKTILSQYGIEATDTDIKALTSTEKTGDTKLSTLPPNEQNITMNSLENQDNTLILNEINEKASNLVLTEKNGLEKGLNEVTMEIDGKQVTKIVNNELGFVNLNSNFEDASEAKVLSLKPLGSYNVEVDEIGAIYSIKYTINGEEKEIFITTTKENSVFRKKEQVLDIDNLIESNNLIGIENVKVSKVTVETIMKKARSIFEKFTSASEIFMDNNYGGNQSDVQNLLSASQIEKINQLNTMLKNQLITHEVIRQRGSINIQKSLLLYSLIDKYFPNTSDIQKTNLAEHYAQGGCEYMAIANSLATYMGSLQNGSEIFKSLFGFDLTVTDGFDLTVTGRTNISYNIEAIAFDIYLTYFSEITNSNVEATLKSNSVGINIVDFNQKITEYFKKHNIKLLTSHIDIVNKPSNLANGILTDVANNNTGFSILEANGFDLELLDNKNEDIEAEHDASLKDSIRKGKIRENIGGHAMLVTDIDELGNLIVSSWKKKYKFLADSIKKNNSSYARIRNIHFKIM